MGTKTNDYCSQCPQKAGCKEVYERLGRSEAPNVVGKVMAAFLLPIGVFVAMLMFFDRLLPVFEVEKIRTLAVFALSLGPTLAAIGIVRQLQKTGVRGQR